MCKIKGFRKRSIERKLNKFEKRYRDILSLLRKDREMMGYLMRLEGHKFKTCMQLSSEFQEEKRKLGIEALYEARRLSAEFHNPEGVLFFDVQRPLEPLPRSGVVHSSSAPSYYVNFQLYEDKPYETTD